MKLGHDGRSHSALAAVALFIALAPSSAWAYVDPGSGSLLLQIVMSAFFGAVFLGRNLIAKAVSTTRRWFGGRSETPPAPPTPPDHPAS